MAWGLRDFTNLISNVSNYLGDYAGGGSDIPEMSNKFSCPGGHTDNTQVGYEESS
jgi:hypothetical protein